jgi:hypothetical protein
LRQKARFRADIEIADVVAGPCPVDTRVAIDDAADFRVAGEERPQIAVDARVEEEGSENLEMIFDSDGKRAREVADVRKALDEICAAAVAADRPFLVRQDLTGRNKPHASVAEERRGRRSGVRRR